MTDRQTLRGAASGLVLASLFVGLALTGCGPQTTNAASAPPPLAALPLSTAAAAPIAPGPAADALPPAPPARLGRLADPSDRYAFADRAYAMSTGFGDAPPDYTFDYGDGEQPWVWRGDDQSVRVAEALPGGGERYYYYDPGVSTPYLVRDPDYSYGYDDGVLVVVYDSEGRALADAQAARQAAIAGRLLARAASIYQASQQEQREAVAEANWQARREQIDAQRAQWAAEQAADQQWAAYHAQHQQEEDAHWASEQYRREAEAARFAQQINDAALASQDLDAARQAQARAAAVGQQPRAPQTGGAGFAPRPQPFTPPSAPPASPPPSPGQAWSGQPEQHRPQGQAFGAGGPQSPPHPQAQPTPGPSGPTPAEIAARQSQADAQRRAELAQSQAAAAHQAQANAAAQAAAAHAASAQAAAARQAQIAAMRQSQMNARAQAQTQAQAPAQAQAAALARRNAQLAQHAVTVAPKPPHPTAKSPPAPPPAGAAAHPHHERPDASNAAAGAGH